MLLCCHWFFPGQRYVLYQSEVNLTYPRFAIMNGGVHNGIDSYPYDKFWKVVGEYGCPVVFGIDAHNPIDLLVDYSDEIKYMVETFNLNVVELQRLLFYLILNKTIHTQNSYCV